jgi:microcin C transport system permease protein
MLSYILRRLLLILPTLIGITMLVFFVMKLSPGDVATVLQSAEGDMRAEERKRIQEYVNKRYGLNDPIIVQYFRWLNQISPVGIKYPGTEADLPRLERIFERYRSQGQSPQQAIENLTLLETFRGEEVALDQAGDLTVNRVRPGAGWPATWRVGLKTPDLGESFLRRQPVLDMILEALPITLLLNLITIPIVYGIAVTTGIYAAKHRGKAFDIGTGITFIGLYSLPTIWVGVMLLGFFASRDYFQWFPTGGLHDTLADRMTFLPTYVNGDWQRGWLLDVLWHLVLPVICLTYGGYAFLSKLMRASVLENLHADFARTARAKGLKENVVLMRHVLSNSVLPLITVAASILPSLLGGSVIVEEIFSLNGMGRVMLDAIKQKDQEVVLSVICVVALISLLSLLAADICYALADPRVSYE